MTRTFDGPATTISFCWMLERRDGAGLAFTSHDRNLGVGGQRYDAAPGLEPSAIIRGSGDEPAGEVSGALTDAALVEEDLLAGRWDGARSRLLGVDWQQPDKEPVTLAVGELGDISFAGSEFQADLLGPAEKLKAAVCPSTSPECRATLGDKRCRVNMAGRSLRAQVVRVVANEVELDRPVSNEFAKGKLRWLSGETCGLQSVVSSCNGRHILLREAPRLPVHGTVQVILYEGCDKRLETCSSRFANVANFRGEPHLPGNDLLTRYPGA